MKKKRILVCCGSGIATSTIVMEEVAALEKKANLNYKPEFYQCSLSELKTLAPGCEMIISTQQVRQDFGVPVVRAIGILTGMGIEENRAEIIAALEKLND